MKNPNHMLLAVALAIAMASPIDAQERNEADARDFRMFVESLSVRRNARTCERGIEDYKTTFADLYRTWSEKHQVELSRGEAIFRAALKTKDLKDYPFTTRAVLARTDEALGELARPPKSSGPLTLDARTTAACEKVLASLKD